ncbi:hypothetical protein S40285_09894 [Stachybotrys chlorohalonatus IBT 40285]|uniref:Uncharacterized protein n=1 Tax=Stachybotrys chlorohalonatus (strain IBT 40285) TaxID=1283841 RepID=A0A084QR49_STAC4|nr:hypothetical protein S40285_09894 [Stachybotrys chlorohalonata IBT 40285]
MGSATLHYTARVGREIGRPSSNRLRSASIPLPLSPLLELAPGAVLESAVCAVAVAVADAMPCYAMRCEAMRYHAVLVLSLQHLCAHMATFRCCDMPTMWKTCALFLRPGLGRPQPTSDLALGWP